MTQLEIMSSTENFDTSGLSEETKLVLEQAMMALSFNQGTIDPSPEARAGRSSSLGKLSDYEAESYNSSNSSPQDQPRASLSPAIIPRPMALPATRAAPPPPTRSQPPPQNGNGSDPWNNVPGPVYRKVDDLISDVDVPVSQLAAQPSQGMVPGYRSSGQISVPRQSQPYTAPRPAQKPMNEQLAAHLRQAVDKDIAAMVENIKTQQQAPDSARGFNLSDPALTDEDKKLLYQEMYGEYLPSQ